MRRLQYGYCFKAGKVVIEPTEALIVKKIFNEFLSGKKRAQIAQSIQLSHIQIQRILTCQNYLGDRKYPALLDKKKFVQAQEKLKQTIKTRQHTKIQLKSETKFYRGVLKQKSNDPFKQAEYIYTQIESEANIYG